jgi:hypothetical protein
MNIETIQALSEEYSKSWLYQGSFKHLAVSIHRLIERGNKLLIVEAGDDIEDEVLLVFTIYSEAIHCLHWPAHWAHSYLQSVEHAQFPISDFLALYESQFKGNSVFEKIDLSNIDVIYSFTDPAFDEWEGDFLIKSGGKKFMLMWDFTEIKG